MMVTYVTTLAQETTCINFFPQREGASLVYKKYTASDSLLEVVTYKTVMSTKDEEPKPEVDFIIEDGEGKILDNGRINSYCDKGIFYLNIMNHVSLVTGYFNRDNEYLGDFLDYPNTLDTSRIYSGNLSLRGGEFIARSKDTKQVIVSVKAGNRVYEKNEDVITPVGTFKASKVTFSGEISRYNTLTPFRCTEWYAPELGIIRTELYNNKGELVNYSVLSSK